MPEAGKFYMIANGVCMFPASQASMEPNCGMLTRDKKVENLDLVSKWNRVALRSIRVSSMQPPRASRLLAKLSWAVDDAVKICKRG